MFGYFYHSLTKKAIIAFGSLFNDMYIARYDSQGKETTRIKVPLAYMSKQLFISRFLQSADLSSPFAISLPRMSFTFSSLTYDSGRKSDSFQRTFSGSGNSYAFRYGRLPYNILFNLNIYAKNTDDALQIMEQIIPWFGPEYSVNVRMLNPTDSSVDVPFVIQNITFDETGAETTFENRKIVTVSIEFVCKMFYYGPLKSLDVKSITGPNGQEILIPEGMIGKVIVNEYAGLDIDQPFQTMITGITGNVNPENFNETEGNTYLVYAKNIFN